MAGALLLAGTAQYDLHTSTDTLSHPDQAAKCRRPFTPATIATDGRLLTPPVPNAEPVT